MRTIATKPTNLPTNLTIKQLDELPDAPASLRWFCIGPFCWGKAVTALESFRNARSNGGAGKYTLHLAPGDAEIDGVNGTLYYRSTEAGIRINAATVTAKGY